MSDGMSPCQLQCVTLGESDHYSLRFVIFVLLLKQENHHFQEYYDSVCLCPELDAPNQPDFSFC